MPGAIAVHAAANQGRSLKVPIQSHYEALQEMRLFIAGEEGRRGAESHLYVEFGWNSGQTRRIPDP